MGEYEPDDSRNITQKDGHVPGEPPRTGPREDEARRKAQNQTDPKPMPQEKQQAQQFSMQGDQSQHQGQPAGGQSQSQSQSQSAPPQPEPEQSGPWGDDAPRMDSGKEIKGRGSLGAQDMHAQPGGLLAEDQPEAIDDPAGLARPDHDQYDGTQPQNMHQQSAEEERKRREQAVRQTSDDRGHDIDTDGTSGMHDAPGARDDDSDQADRDTDAAVVERETEKRGYGGDGEAEKEAYDRR